ncbi:alanine--glyoxylate aminotransferase family protein [bacterium]|nr:alanine--glyoxylate aminotransferase family protein [bacterium]
MRKEYLYSPGPTTVPPEALSVMAKPIFHHRTKRHREMFQEVLDGLKYVLATQNDVLVFASSGTGAMEGSVANLLSPGDKVITVSGGKFGERFGEICRAYGAKVDEITVEWGHAVDPAEIEKRLSDEVKAVYVTLCETSTGVHNDIQSIAGIVSKTPAVLVVDAISGLLCDDLLVDEWNIDVAIGGSQKGLMIPPGVSFCSVSEKAWALAESSRMPKYYFDFQKTKKSADKADTPFTPAVTLLRALRETLSMVCGEGRENLLRLYAALAGAVHAGAAALGLQLFSNAPSNAVTAINAPEGIDVTELLSFLRDDLGVTFAGGQAKLKGKIFRICSMGYTNEFDILTAMSALEFGLKKLGYEFELGAGIKAAEEVLQ